MLEIPTIKGRIATAPRPARTMTAPRTAAMCSRQLIRLRISICTDKDSVAQKVRGPSAGGRGTASHAAPKPQTPGARHLIESVRPGGYKKTKGAPAEAADSAKFLPCPANAFNSMMTWRVWKPSSAIAAAAFRSSPTKPWGDLLKKHKQPVGLMASLKESMGTRAKPRTKESVVWDDENLRPL